MIRRMVHMDEVDYYSITRHGRIHTIAEQERKKICAVIFKAFHPHAHIYVYIYPYIPTTGRKEKGKQKNEKFTETQERRNQRVIESKNKDKENLKDKEKKENLTFDRFTSSFYKQTCLDRHVTSTTHPNTTTN